jgi:hypothetical protein
MIDTPAAPVEALSGQFRTLAHPPSLHATHVGRSLHAPRTTRRSLAPPLHNSNEAFLCDDLLTRDECAQYIAAAEQCGFHSLEREFPRVRFVFLFCFVVSCFLAETPQISSQEYRSNDRVLTLAPAAVMDELLQRLAAALRDDDALLCEPMGPGAGGVWIPAQLNECLKIGRYRPGARDYWRCLLFIVCFFFFCQRQFYSLCTTKTKGCHFAPHADGPWCPRANTSSIFTVVVYLNDAHSHDTVVLRGGETQFLRERRDGTQNLFDFG